MLSIVVADNIWYGMVWYSMVWYDIVWYCMVVDIMLGDDNAAAKWESPASRRWSPDGQILFPEYRILSPHDNDHHHDIIVLLVIIAV